MLSPFLIKCDDTNADFYILENVTYERWAASYGTVQNKLRELGKLIKSINLIFENCEFVSPLGMLSILISLMELHIFGVQVNINLSNNDNLIKEFVYEGYYDFF